MQIDPTRRHRATTLAAMALALLAIGAPEAMEATPFLIWNATASTPTGLYRVVPASALRVGDLVVSPAPPALAGLFAERGYLPRGVPLLKHIAALEGDHVCAEQGIVAINGNIVADTLLVDGRGRPLPAWRGCRTLAPGEVFLLNAEIRASLDGRYFGPVPLASIRGRAVPIWAMEAH